MPLPIILGIGAAIAGGAGLIGGVNGAVKMKEANDTMERAKRRHERNVERFENQEKQTKKDMDSLGKFEFEILYSLKDFGTLTDKIANKPASFAKINKDESIPQYERKEIEEVAVGAGIVLGGIGGLGAGALGAGAAGGAAITAITALGTASTGTAIASLSGAAATNAALAALGGGAIAAGGGGIALGTAVLGASTLGVGLLAGGLIFNVVGKGLSDKADEAYSQMLKAEKEIDKACDYLEDLSNVSNHYKTVLESINKLYNRYIDKLNNIVYKGNKRDYRLFNENEMLIFNITGNAVSLLYYMCKVGLVKKGDVNKGEVDEVNRIEVDKSIRKANEFMQGLD
jgi:hypothetical protein